MTTEVHRLRLSTDPFRESAGVINAVLGRDIRSEPAEIARHCLAEHRAINEDIATVAESIALADRLFPRHRSHSWARCIELEIPVFEVQTFMRSNVRAALDEAVHFLTGDAWHFRFVKRPGHPLTDGALPFERVAYSVVMPYSDGLDSFAQAALLAADVGRDNVLKLRSARIGQDRSDLKRQALRVPRNLGPMPKKEQTYRSRPFVFLSFAGIGAFVSGAQKVVVGESGQGALGPALLPYGGEWPFRSVHPGFLTRMARYLGLAFSRPIPIELPQVWCTKAEVLGKLREKNLLDGWEGTRSCSARPAGRHGIWACGLCGGCVLRALAARTADLQVQWDRNAFSLISDTAEACDGMMMSPNERDIVVRSFGTMAEFASILRSRRGAKTIEKESILFGTQDILSIGRNLADLVRRHDLEWRAFVSGLPERGWARAIAEQL